MAVPSIRDLDWLAGWVEGEGCYSMARTRPHLVEPIVTISTTDKDVAERGAKILRAEVRERQKAQPHHKQPYEVRLGGARALGWMLTLYPLMASRRRARIREVVLAWRSTVGPRLRRRARCHPDRFNLARGLCSACYQARLARERGVPPKLARHSAPCHPQREHLAKGLCSRCYQRQRRAACAA